MILDTCPICGGSGCRTYPLMLARWIAGRDRTHWRRVHDNLNPKVGTMVPAQARPTASAATEALKLVKACPHRTRDSGCGCSGHRCALGKGRGGVVAHRDCLVCVGLLTSA